MANDKCLTTNDKRQWATGNKEAVNEETRKRGNKETQNAKH